MSGNESTNRVFIIRHGESEANVAKLIVSDPVNGVPSYGLTDRGRQQAEEVSQSLLELCGQDLPSRLIIISSDFKRTQETAETIHCCLQPPHPVKLDQRLRERHFGSLEGGHSSNYQKVWDLDAKSADHTSYDCESVTSVFLRTLELVDEIEHENQGKIVLLVSHGDTCQITLTKYRGLAPEEHRQLPHLKNCDIVELNSNK